jgi:nucleotide-binding universal stress UspA family protein
MFERALVPLDGSRASEASLAAARLLSRAFGTTLILGHIVEARPPRSVHGQPHLAEAVSAAAYLAEVAQRLTAEGLSVTTHVHEGGEREVAESLAAHAAELGFDLVVMAAHGRRGALDYLSASLPLKVAAAGCSAVYLARRAAATEAEARPEMILVPLDGRVEHEAALPQAEAIARALSLPIELLAVVPRFGSEAGGGAGAIARLSPALEGVSLEYAAKGAEDYLAALAARVAATGLDVTWRVERGRPARRIKKVAETGRALLVLSTHRRFGMDAALEGCVAFSAATSYPGDSLIVPVPGCR